MTWYYCSDCTAYSGALAEGRCPACRSDQVAEDPSAATAGQGLRVTFSIFGCETCDEVYTLGDGLTSCPGCGEPHVDDDPHVVARQAAYKSRLAELSNKLDQAARHSFSSRGRGRLTIAEYVPEFARPVLDRLRAEPDRILSLMSRGNWDQPEDAATVADWAEVEAGFDSLVAEVLAMKRKLPPPTLLAHHRRTVGVFISFTRSGLGFFSALLAPDLSAAKRVQHRSQRQLNRTVEALARATELSSAVLPWAAGGEQSLNDAEAAYGPGFCIDAIPELKNLHLLDPVAANPFWELAVPAAALHDPTRRMMRVSATRAILEDGTSGHPHWYEESETLIRETIRGWRQLVDQHSRLSRAISQMRSTGPASAIEDLFAVAKNLIEGPFKRFGAILCIAAKAHGDARASITDESFDSARHVSDILNILKGRAPVLVDKIDKLIRNASAHYDMEIRHGWVFIEHVGRPGEPVQADRMSPDDVVEQVANLSEATLAMALGIATWALTVASGDMAKDFREIWISGTG